MHTPRCPHCSLKKQKWIRTVPRQGLFSSDVTLIPSVTNSNKSNYNETGKLKQPLFISINKSSMLSENSILAKTLESSMQQLAA